MFHFLQVLWKILWKFYETFNRNKLIKPKLIIKILYEGILHYSYVPLLHRFET